MPGSLSHQSAEEEFQQVHSPSTGTCTECLLTQERVGLRKKCYAEKSTNLIYSL